MDVVYLVVILGAVLAGFVQGLSGFAFGMISMSIWIWVLEPQVAALLAIFGALTGQLIAVLTTRRKFNRTVLMPFLIGGCCGIPLGMMVLPHLDVNWFKALLGMLLVVLCPAMLLSKWLPKIQGGGKWADGLSGVCGGIMSAIGGMAGVLPTIWCVMRGYERDTQRAVIQNYNLAMLSVTMVSYLLSGMVPAAAWPMFALVAASMVVPVLLGARMYIGISDVLFRQIVLGLLMCSGVALLVSSVPKLLERLAA